MELSAETRNQLNYILFKSKGKYFSSEVVHFSPLNIDENSRKKGKQGESIIDSWKLLKGPV